MCLLEAQRRWCLTGTPIQNKLHDFGTLVQFLRFSPFNSEALFRRHIIRPLQIAHGDGLRRLRMLIGFTCLRRDKDILNLPARIDKTQYIHFNIADRRVYEDCKKYSAILIEYALTDKGTSNGQTYLGILQSILRLRLLCDHQELLSAEVKNRLWEYPPVDEALDTPPEICLVECGLCSELIDPAETDVVSFPRCSHTICNKCSTLSVSDSNKFQHNGPCCPICAETNRLSHVMEQTDITLQKEGMVNVRQSAKVQALMENLRQSKSEGFSQPEKR